ncbi:MAG TPA: DNA polymerase IV [Leptolinea sp.]
MKVRKILHMDLDAFFCSVEELRDPSLKGKPFAVGGKPGSRGVVSSASYAARKFGVRSAMPTARALRLCPELILVSSWHSDYAENSQKVMAIVGDFTPLVEPLSIDEAFMDFSDLPETPLQISRSLQSRINCETHLPCSIGAASNKLVAKIANDYGKHIHREPTPPNAITIVEPGKETEFLAPLSVDALWGVGPKTAESLKKLGIITIGDLTHYSLDEMTRLFGQNGRELANRARGIDDRPVEIDHTVKSISQEITFEKDVCDREILVQTIKRLATEVGSQLRKQGFTARTIRIKIRWADFKTHTRQVSLSLPTDHDSVILHSALDLFGGIWPEGKPVRLIGVGTSQLSNEPVQLDLLDIAGEKEGRLLRSVDELREKYGHKILLRGFEIRKDQQE